MLAGLILLISYLKFNPFLAFLIVCIIGGLGLGIPLSEIAGAVQKGIGDTLGGLISIIILGAMMGKLVADSGAAQQISSTLIKLFGEKNIAWGMMFTGFVVGIPLFYNVGFVLMIPLIFAVVRQFNLHPLVAGIPMMASLSVAHGFLPPHPSPAALVNQFNADMGVTLLYGILAAVPTIIIAGPVFAKTLGGLPIRKSTVLEVNMLDEKVLPSKFASFFTALFPVVILAMSTILSNILEEGNAITQFFKWLSDPLMVMLVSTIVALFTLGILRSRKIEEVMGIFTDSVKDVGMLVLIVAGSGSLKEVLLVSGVSNQIGDYLQTLPLNPLVLGWLIAAFIRICVGSATIAGLTAAGILVPLVQSTGVNPSLMVLSVGAGSLMFSHINDTGFWLFKEYFNLSIGETIRSWSLMETIVSIVGLVGVLVIQTLGL
jgi:Gnt-I system high-affinity gluconate transporter